MRYRFPKRQRQDRSMGASVNYGRIRLAPALRCLKLDTTLQPYDVIIRKAFIFETVKEEVNPGHKYALHIRHILMEFFVFPSCFWLAFLLQLNYFQKQ